MNWKKRTLIIVAVIVSATSILAILANRDLTKIYGGLTKQVDTSQFAIQTKSTTIVNVNILSPDGESFIPNQTVSIENGIISSINKLSNTSDHLEIINGKGKFLIPGLTDSHVHLFKSPNDLLLYVANGITQIRELIGEEDHLLWRQQIKDGRLGPDMFIASPRIGSFETLEGWFMSWSQGFLNINNTADAQRKVKELHQQGYDAVKIYSHINAESYQAVTTTAQSLGMKVVGHVPWGLELADIYSSQNGIAHLEELMNALNREFGGYTAKSGRRWDGSGFSSETADDFLEFVGKRSDEIANDLIAHDIAVTSTLWLVENFIRQKVELDNVLSEVELEYENPGISEWSTMTPGGIGWLPEVNRYKWPEDWNDERRAKSKRYWETYAEACRVILKNLLKKGVKIMAGTDANLPPTVPGFSLHDELISLNRAGMTSSQVLRSATSAPSQWLDNNAGEILVGRKANLVLLNKNPLLDISNTKSINSVVINGKLLDRTLLDNILESVKEANNSSRNVNIDWYLN